MELFRSLNEIPDSLKHGALTIGNFDGVHRGHARILECVKTNAVEVEGPSIVFTFDPHPVDVLRPDLAHARLTTTERKAELMAALGIDAVVAYPTDMELLSLTPEQFFDRVLRSRLAAKAVVEGPNFFFGHHRAGNIARLRQLCDQNKIKLEIVDPLRDGSDYVSSSRVRAAISAGDITLANEMLTSPYHLDGVVAHGAGRGNQIGFPTANLDSIATLLPKEGVYAGRSMVHGITYAVAINIGSNPTFDDMHKKVEVHLIDFQGDLYGERLAVDITQRLRDVRTFSGVDELVQQLKIDIQASRKAAE